MSAAEVGVGRLAGDSWQAGKPAAVGGGRQFFADGLYHGGSCGSQRRRLSGRTAAVLAEACRREGVSWGGGVGQSDGRRRCWAYWRVVAATAGGGREWLAAAGRRERRSWVSVRQFAAASRRRSCDFRTLGLSTSIQSC
jgi:hypothetical protein